MTCMLRSLTSEPTEAARTENVWDLAYPKACALNPKCKNRLNPMPLNPQNSRYLSGLELGGDRSVGDVLEG